MDQKKLESSHFKQFRKIHWDFPDGEVWHEDRPDFLIHTDDGMLGIEHCLVHIPSSSGSILQAEETQTDEIVSIAKEHSELRGTKNINVSILFGNYSPLKSKQRLNLGRDIARLIHEELRTIDTTIPFQKFKIRNPDIAPQISSINLLTLKEDIGNHWSCVRAGWAMKHCIDLFQETIDKKAMKYKTYMEKCDECWLLLVARLNPSGFIHPDENSLKHIYNSPFSATYFMEYGLGKLERLKTSINADS